MRYSIPLTVFILILIVLGLGLNIDPRRVPSPLIGKPLPEFSLPTVADAQTILTASDLHGQVVLLNIWASWCVACRTEHPILLKLTQEKGKRIYGVNYKDERGKALEWLQQYGNPYLESVFDENGRTGIELGVYGVPETFVLDKDGIIRYKHIGPITQQAMKEIIMPLLIHLEESKPMRVKGER